MKKFIYCFAEFLKRNYFILLIIFLSISLDTFSQSVSINNDGTPPNPNAMLDIKASNKGLLIPRTSTTTRFTIPNTKGLLVYDTTTNSFWYNDGNAWNNISGGGAGWSLTGNSGTDTSVNFIGTTDSKPLAIKVNNTLSGIIDNSSNGNTGLGYQTFLSNTSGQVNTAIGYSALAKNTIGNGNSAFGFQSLSANTTGPHNTAIGLQTLFANSTGRYNTAIGSTALFGNNSGNNNTATGYAALYSNSTGVSNTATGTAALSSNTTGYSNTAIGESSLLLNTTGFENTASGDSALYNNQTGQGNTAIGYQALYSNINGAYNTAIGKFADVTAGNLINAIAIGWNAKVSSDFSIQLGDDAILDVYTNNGCTIHAGAFVSGSDARLKNSIMPLTLGLQFISMLKPVTYLYNDQHDKHFHSGFLAQDVEKAASALGATFSGIYQPKTDKDYYGLSYQDFIMPLVNGEKELKIQNEQLKKDNKDLKNQLSDLEKRVTALEKK